MSDKKPYTRWTLEGDGNAKIFDYPSSEDSNRGEGPSNYHANDSEGQADYQNRLVAKEAGDTATKRAFDNGEYDSTGTYRGRK